MPTAEMLKKLLEEFADKESHTQAEIKVVHEEIGSLEKRINQCRERLRFVVADKEKVADMMARYSARYVAKSTTAKATVGKVEEGVGKTNPLTSAGVGANTEAEGAKETTATKTTEAQSVSAANISDQSSVPGAKASPTDAVSKKFNMLDLFAPEPGEESSPATTETKDEKSQKLRAKNDAQESKEPPKTDNSALRGLFR